MFTQLKLQIAIKDFQVLTGRNLIFYSPTRLIQFNSQPVKSKVS